MKIYKDTTVFEESLKRIERLFNEFPNVIVGISGGKDSTVIFHLTMQVAKKLNRLPLKVLFLDQEIEWQATIDQVKKIMYHPDVEPLWIQVKFQLFNATSIYEHWLWCWDERKKDIWMREKDPVSIKENIFNETRFAKMFTAIVGTLFPKTPTCYISGMRVEESPTRKLALTARLTYKDITWGKILNRKKSHYTFYPIYDWSYLDVWKAIHDNKWEYNKIYDLQYQYGVPLQNMRVSNLHHETAVGALFYLQEIEPETYEKAVRRIGGLDMAGKLGSEDYFIRELPFMFKDWKEYRDYLLEKLILEPKWKERFKKKFNKMDIKYGGMKSVDKMYKMQVQSIITNDWEFIKMNNWERKPPVDFYRKWLKTGLYPPNPSHRTFIP